MAESLWTVGVLARASGLTVRALHHYDEIGLVVPSRRTAAGHRRYTQDDLLRLQQVLSLRKLGFPLSEIAAVLHRPESSPAAILALHVERLDHQVLQLQQIRARLARLAQALREGGAAAPDLLRTMEEITMYEKYFDETQRATLEARAAAIGPERMQQAQEEWMELIAQVRGHMEAGTPPSDPAVRALAVRWQEKVAEFTGGDPAIAEGVRQVYRDQPDAAQRHGMALDPAMFAYVGSALR